MQAGYWFNDIRVSPQADYFSSFGGLVNWQAPWLRFVHLINTSGTLSDDDIGRISFTDFGCLENGTFERDGETVPFEESWYAPQGAQASLVYVQSHGGTVTGLEIQQPDFCIISLQQGAACFRRQGKRWRCLYRVGEFPRYRLPLGNAGKPGWRLAEQLTP